MLQRTRLLVFQTQDLMLDLKYDGSQYLCILKENVVTVYYELDFAFW